MDAQSNSGTTFQSWGIVEVMGHQVYAGLIGEQTIGGAAFVRVDVPETDSDPGFTKLLGAGAIFAITPTTEEVARRAACRTAARPVSLYGLLPAPSSPAAADDSVVEDDEPSDDDGTDSWIADE